MFIASAKRMHKVARRLEKCTGRETRNRTVCFSPAPPVIFQSTKHLNDVPGTRWPYVVAATDMVGQIQQIRRCANSHENSEEIIILRSSFHPNLRPVGVARGLRR